MGTFGGILSTGNPNAGGKLSSEQENGEENSMGNLKLLYTGKTKNVYALENGNCLLTVSYTHLTLPTKA